MHALKQQWNVWDRSVGMDGQNLVHRFADGVDHDTVNWCRFPVHDMFRRINAPLSQVIRLAFI